MFTSDFNFINIWTVFPFTTVLPLGSLTICWRSKSKVPANDAYSAQNSRFSRTKEYIIWWKSTNIPRYVVVRCPTLRQWRFTSVNFNQNLLVAPTFVKRGNLFVHWKKCLGFISHMNIAAIVIHMVGIHIQAKLIQANLGFR